MGSSEILERVKRVLDMYNADNILLTQSGKKAKKRCNDDDVVMCISCEENIVWIEYYFFDMLCVHFEIFRSLIFAFSAHKLQTYRGKKNSMS